MLVVDLHALRAVDVLHFSDDVLLNCHRPANAQYIMGVQRTLGEFVAGNHPIALAHLEARAERHRVFMLFAGIGGDDYLADAFDLRYARYTIVLRHGGQPFGFSSLKQLLHPGQASGDVVARDSARVERSHRELRAGLADGLSRDSAHSLAHFHQVACGQVPPVTIDAHAVPGAALEH